MTVLLVVPSVDDDGATRNPVLGARGLRGPASAAAVHEEREHDDEGDEAGE
jgi:hypothetical protein